MSDDTDLERCFDEALRLEMRGDWEEALRIYEGVATGFPDEQEGKYAANCAARLRERKRSVEVAQEKGVYSFGNLLVIGNFAELPTACVKCNSPKAMPTRVEVHKTPWIAYLFLFLPLGHFLGGSMTRRVRMTIGLCAACRRQRLRRKITSAAIGAVVVLALATWVMYQAAGGGPPVNIEWWPFILSIMTLSLIGFGIGLACVPEVIKAKRMDERFVWVKGFGGDYISAFPEFRARAAETPRNEVGRDAV